MARTQASAGTSARGAQGASTDLDDLNRLLRDELSAVETYRQALDKNRDAFENDARFRELSQMHEDHQQAAAELRQLIQQMGGSPVDDSGAWGTWANTVMGTARLFGDKAALKALKEGEESGIKDYQQVMQERGAARELQSVLTSAMSKTQQHIRLLDRMIDAV